MALGHSGPQAKHAAHPVSANTGPASCATEDTDPRSGREEGGEERKEGKKGGQRQAPGSSLTLTLTLTLRSVITPSSPEQSRRLGEEPPTPGLCPHSPSPCQAPGSNPP